MLDDLTGVTLHSALRGLAARQRTIADNVANVQTPGFQAGRVLFEESLAGAVRGGDRVDVARVAPSTQLSLEPTRLDGNNVNLDREVLANVDTNLRYQLTTQAVSERAALLRSAMRTM